MESEDKVPVKACSGESLPFPAAPSASIAGRTMQESVYNPKPAPRHLPDDALVVQGQVPISAPLLFTANDCLDVGLALGSPVSLDYCDKVPFKFNGKIGSIRISPQLLRKQQTY